MNTRSKEADKFRGFAPGAMTFFSELAKNQNKAWMAANKARYTASIREPLATLVVALSDRLRTQRVPLRGDPKHSIFRANRDVRFSADKRPYNDHASAALTRDGDKKSPGVLYMQFSDVSSMVAAGFFRPEADVLHRLREGLAANPKGWSKMTSSLAGAGFKLGRDDTLIRPPKGFDHAAAEVVDDLKLKSWTITRSLSPAEIASPDLAELIADFAQAALPLLKFGWGTLTRSRSRPAVTARSRRS